MGDLDDFFFNCGNDYEEKMDKVLNSVKSIQELQFSHHEHKSQVLKEIPEKWRATFGAKELPQNVKQTVTQKIEDTFKLLKKHFEDGQASGKPPPQKSVDYNNQLQEDALNTYTEIMDKFFVRNPTPTRGEVAHHHQLFSKEAVSKALKKGGDKEGAHIMTKLAFALDARYKEYLRKVEEAGHSESNIAIGIDLGTTMCCVMVVNPKGDGKPEIVPNLAQGGSRTTPSYVAYLENGSDTFGAVAKNRAFKMPEVTIYDAKRMIGRPWTDPNFQNDKEHWPFQVVEENGNPKIKTWGRSRYPHEVSSRLLAQFRVMAEEHLDLPRGTIRKAVVTVPAYFTEPQRRATNDAAMCAGLEVLNILSEPTAAAIAYSFERRLQGNRNALIYDLGGGTFDVAIAKVSESEVEILGVDGDTHLGGQDVDQFLMDFCIDEFKKAEEFDLRAGRDSAQKLVRDDTLRALSRVKLQCEKAKEELASSKTASVFIERLVGAKDMDVQITREKLNELCRPLVQETLDIVTRALKDVKSKGIKGKEDIDDVILVGGSTRLLLVSQMLSEYFAGKQLCVSINPDEAVAYGAAIQAHMMTKSEVKEGNKRPEIRVTDVLPLSVGIETLGERFSRILGKNERIPCEHSKTYTTSADNQTAIQVTVFQGEEEKSTDNKRLGEFILEGFPPKPAGEEKVEVNMKISSMGILHVEAVSVTTQNRNAVTITSDRLGMDMATMDELRKKFENLGEP